MKLNSPLALLLSTYSLFSTGARAQEKKPFSPARWAYVVRDAEVEVRSGATQRKRPALHLGRGALVAVIESKSRGSTPSARVRAVDPATFESITGWVDSSRIELEPAGDFPSDGEVLKALGGVYLEDITAADAEIVRYVIHQGRQDPALLCFVGSAALPKAKLQVFQKSNGKFILGPFVEFPSSEMESGITRLEVQDLMGDGHDLLITREPFQLQQDNGGVNMVIRRIAGDALQTLWQTPLEYRNLTSFAPQRQVLQPPERNIGAAGTVTTGAVEFRAHGALREPVWKGKVQFYILGRDEALDIVRIEKLCPWDGTKFAPLQ